MLRERDPQVVSGAGVTGIDLQGPAVVTDRLLEPAPGREDRAQIVVHLHRFRLDPEHLEVVEDRLVRPAPGIERDGQVVVRRGGPRLDPKSLQKWPIASSVRPRSFNAWPRLLWASASRGAIRTAQRRALTASSARPARPRAIPRLLCTAI